MPDLLHSTDAIATAFVRAIVALDFDRLESALAPSIRFCALTPASCQEASTAADARRLIEGWFEGSDLVELVQLNIDDIADRLHLAYRLRVHDPGVWYLVEQQAFADVVDSRFASLSILCSGFHPIETPAGAEEPVGGSPDAVADPHAR